jgi:phage shock protein PspC (stress-responsive transcriptional regulator)
MVRSFSDRVFGGVCGGLAAVLPFSAWWIRGAVAILTLLTGGLFAAVYVLLWWLLPQDSIYVRRRGGAGLFLFTLLISIGALALWAVHLGGGLRGANGTELLWPIILSILALVFFIKQVIR